MSDDPKATGTGKERIAKVIARAGVASRREAEQLIGLGLVAVNGEVLDSPAVTVGPNDVVTVRGQPLPEVEPPRVWRYHKPEGLVTTTRDEKGRPTIFDRLPDDLPRVVSVGRLDLTSEGLLLLTNDGGLKRHLELPSNAWVRRYRVRVHGIPNVETLARLADGITVDGVRYGGIEASLDRQQGANAWLTMALKEGKNREIRRVMEHLGLPVSRLIRLSYGPFHLGNMEKGAVEEVPTRALKEMVRDFFGDAGKPSSAESTGGTARPKAKLTQGPSGPVKPAPGRPGSAKPKPRRAGDGDRTRSVPTSDQESGARRGGKPGRNPSSGKPGPRSAARSEGRPEGRPSGRSGRRPSGSGGPNGPGGPKRRG